MGVSFSRTDVNAGPRRVERIAREASYSDLFQNYIRIPETQEQGVQTNRDPNLEVLSERSHEDQEENVEDEPTVPMESESASDSQNAETLPVAEERMWTNQASASTPFPAETSMWSPRSCSSGSSAAAELIPITPIIKVTTKNDREMILEPGHLELDSSESSSEEQLQVKDRAGTPGLALQKGKFRSKPKSSKGKKISKAKNWVRYMKDSLESSFEKASSSGASKTKDFCKKILSKFTSSPEGSAAASQNPSSSTQRECPRDDAQPGPSGIQSKKKGKTKPSERKLLRENARGYGYNLNTRMRDQLMKESRSDPVLSMSYRMYPSALSPERRSEARHSWTPGLNRETKKKNPEESKSPDIVRVKPLKYKPASQARQPPASRSSLSLDLAARPTSFAPVGPRSLGLPERTGAIRRTSNTLQVPGPNSAAGLPGPAWPEIPQEDPVIPSSSTISRRKRPVALPLSLPSSAFAKVLRKKKRFVSPAQKESITDQEDESESNPSKVVQSQALLEASTEEYVPQTVQQERREEEPTPVAETSEIPSSAIPDIVIEGLSSGTPEASAGPSQGDLDKWLGIPFIDDSDPRSSSESSL